MEEEEDYKRMRKSTFFTLRSSKFKTPEKKDLVIGSKRKKVIKDLKEKDKEKEKEIELENRILNSTNLRSSMRITPQKKIKRIAVTPSNLENFLNKDIKLQIILPDYKNKKKIFQFSYNTLLSSAISKIMPEMNVKGAYALYLPQSTYQGINNQKKK